MSRGWSLSAGATGEGIVDGKREFDCMIRPFLRLAEDEEITPDTRLRDLGLDSLREIELLFAIEDAYGFTVPDDRLTESAFATYGNLLTMVLELRGQAGGDAA
jgi:acyl carrier protein